jgi:hypothetical protein
MRRLAMLLAVTVVTTGCATAPVLRKQSFDFKTTGLFRQPCNSPEVLAAKQTIAVNGDGLETRDNECNSVHLLRMVERFATIQETDEAKGIAGDTIDEVRAKGFSIYSDAEGRQRRPNTRPLYGNDALAAVGMGVAPPPLQKPEEIRAYADFMASHYAEEYYEKDLKNVVDRVCLNRRDSRELGDDRTFAIVWRNGHVFKRVIKGGPVDNPKQERALLGCPFDFIVDIIKGIGNKAATGLVAVP